MSTKKNNNVVHTKPKNVVKQENNIYRNDNGKKKVSFYIVLVLIIFWTICSCLTIFNTAKGCDNVAKADGVVSYDTFYGSNLSLNSAILTRDNLLPQSDLNDQCYFKVDLSKTSNGIECFTWFKSAYSDDTDLKCLAFLAGSSIGYGYSTNYPTLQIGYNVPNTDTNSYIPFTDINDLAQFYFGFDVANGEYPDDQNYPLYSFNFLMTLYVWCDIDFNCNVVKAELGGWEAQELAVTNLGRRLSMNYIRYIDNNGKSIYFMIPVLANDIWEDYVLLSDRTYYLVNDFSNDEYYQQGYEYGEAVGIAKGKETGYKNGYEKGKSDGEIIGFQDGVESANQYTFLGLLGAVVDAPLQMITDMLNFDILGMNMSGFVTGILSCALIIFIIRKVL